MNSVAVGYITSPVPVLLKDVSPAEKVLSFLTERVDSLVKIHTLCNKEMGSVGIGGFKEKD